MVGGQQVRSILRQIFEPQNLKRKIAFEKQPSRAPGNLLHQPFARTGISGLKITRCSSGQQFGPVGSFPLSSGAQPIDLRCRLRLEPLDDLPQGMAAAVYIVEPDTQTRFEQRGELHHHQRVQQRVQRHLAVGDHLAGTQTGHPADLPVNLPLPVRQALVDLHPSAALLPLQLQLGQKCAPIHLSAVQARQRALPDVQPLNPLVGGQTARDLVGFVHDRLVHFLLPQLSRPLHHSHGVDLLAESARRTHPHHAQLGQMRQIPVESLHLFRVDILSAAGDDQFLAATGDKQISILVHIAQIPGVQPAVDDHLLGQLRLVEVTGRDVGPPDQDLPFPTLVRIDDGDLLPGQRLPHRTPPHLIRRIDGDNRCRFGQAVALADGHPKALVGVEDLLRQGRSAADHQPQAAQAFDFRRFLPLLTGQPLNAISYYLEQPRHSKQHRGTRSPNRRENLAAVERAQIGDRRPAQNGHQQPSGELQSVVQRQQRKHLIALVHLVHLGQSQQIGDEVAVGEHHPARFDHHTRGENDRRHPVRFHLGWFPPFGKWQRLLHPLLPERQPRVLQIKKAQDLPTRRHLFFGKQRKTALRSDQPPRLGELRQRPDLLFARLRVQRHHRQPQAQGGHAGDNPLGAILSVEQHPFAILQSLALPGMSEIVDPLLQLSIGVALPLSVALHLQGHLGGVAHAGPADQIRDRLDALLDLPALLLHPNLLGRLAQQTLLRFLLPQHVPAQTGQVDLLEEVLPVDALHVHIEDPLLLGRQRLVDFQGVLYPKTAVEIGVRTEKIGVVEHPVQTSLESGQPPLLAGRRPALGQVVQQPLLGSQRVQVPIAEPSTELTHAGERPLRQFRRPAVPTAHRILLEIPPHIVVHGAYHQRVLAAGRHLKDLYFVAAGLGAGGQNRVDHYVDRHHVQRHVLTRRKIGHQAPAVGHDQRIGHLEPEDPAGFRILQTAHRDAGSHDDQRQIAAVFHQHLLTQRLGEGVDVVPAVGLSAAHPLIDQFPLEPAPAAVAHQLGQAFLRELPVVVLFHDLAAEDLLLLGTLCLLAHLLTEHQTVGDLRLRVERLSGRGSLYHLAYIAVQRKQLFGDRTQPATVDVRRRHLHEDHRPAALVGEGEQFLRAQSVQFYGEIQGVVKGHRSRRVHDQIHLFEQLLAHLFPDPQPLIRHIPFDGDDLTAGGCKAPWIFLFKTGEYRCVEQLLLQALRRRNRTTIGLLLRPYQGVDPFHSRKVAEDLGDQALTIKTRASSEQYSASFIEISDHIRRGKNRPDSRAEFPEWTVG